MSDVDGTLIPYNYNALPSPNVVAAIQEAQQVVQVNLVTGRSYAFIKDILSTLKLESGYAVANNGAQVFHIPTNSLIYDQPIELEVVEEIASILHEENIPFYLKQDQTDLAYHDGHFQKGSPIKKGYMFFTDEMLTEERSEQLFDKLAHLPDLTKHKSHHKDPHLYGLNITHAKATKMHGMQIVMEQLGITKEAVIGIGDSYNDFPLLMASGLKVAMGNAIEDLKAIADYVAPSVDDDGMVDVVNKFILNR